MKPTYKGKLFCKYWVTCETGTECPCALTDNIKLGAEHAGLPIAEIWGKPACFKELIIPQQTPQPISAN